MPDLLAQLYRARSRRLRLEMDREPLATLQPLAEAGIGQRRSLLAALRKARPPALIAEVKRASPSAGVIAPGIDPSRVARGYQQAGADAVSVLTEEDHFQGRLEDLGRVRAATNLPVLRKDFLSTEYELAQSAVHGADSALAIVAGLSQARLRRLIESASELRLELLIEVHSEPELERALALGVELLGINNRDLRSLHTDPRVTERLLPLVPPGVLVVSESGYRTVEQLDRARRAGAAAFLVGESLMRSPDPEAWIGAVKGLPPASGGAG